MNSGRQPLFLVRVVRFNCYLFKTFSLSSYSGSCNLQCLQLQTHWYHRADYLGGFGTALVRTGLPGPDCAPAIQEDEVYQVQYSLQSRILDIGTIPAGNNKCNRSLNIPQLVFLPLECPPIHTTYLLAGTQNYFDILLTLLEKFICLLLCIADGICTGSACVKMKRKFAHLNSYSYILPSYAPASWSGVGVLFESTLGSQELKGFTQDVVNESTNRRPVYCSTLGENIYYYHT